MIHSIMAHYIRTACSTINTLIAIPCAVALLLYAYLFKPSMFDALD